MAIDGLLTAAQVCAAGAQDADAAYAVLEELRQLGFVMDSYPKFTLELPRFCGQSTAAGRCSGSMPSSARVKGRARDIMAHLQRNRCSPQL